jgi:hypothetical protein
MESAAADQGPGLFSPVAVIQMLLARDPSAFRLEQRRSC